LHRGSAIHSLTGQVELPFQNEQSAAVSMGPDRPQPGILTPLGSNPIAIASH